MGEKLPSLASLLLINAMKWFVKKKLKCFANFQTTEGLGIMIIEMKCFVHTTKLKCFANFQTTEGLGIMIIEGSHKVIGKGIFISDIQQDSLAYKVTS
jgi:hypothetical protein